MLDVHVKLGKSRPLGLTWVTNTDTQHANTAGLASHVPHHQGVLTGQNVTTTYHIEHTSLQGVER
jgi:hypothetical protein